MKKGLSTIVVILLFVVIFSGVVFYFEKIHKKAPEKKPDKDKFVQEFKDMAGNVKDNGKKEDGDSSGGESGGGSGGGGGGSSKSCPGTQISYSLNSVYQKQKCLESEEGVCVKKQIECSTILRNDDKKGSGEFVVELVFQEKDSSKGLYNKTFSENLQPGEEKDLKGSYVVESSGENGSANKVLICLYHTIKVPQKPVC